MGDPKKTESYTTHGLKKLLQFIKDKNHMNQISAIEILNEPEWMIYGG